MYYMHADPVLCLQLVPANRQRFLDAEGFELMVRMMREKLFAKHCAVKTVDFAIARSRESAAAFVAVDGLKAVFPFFMGKVCAFLCAEAVRNVSIMSCRYRNRLHILAGVCLYAVLYQLCCTTSPGRCCIEEAIRRRRRCHRGRACDCHRVLVG